MCQLLLMKLKIVPEKSHWRRFWKKSHCVVKSQLKVKEDKRKEEGFVPVAPNETLPPSGDSHTQVQGRPKHTQVRYTSVKPRYKVDQANALNRTRLQKTALLSYPQCMVQSECHNATMPQSMHQSEVGTSSQWQTRPKRETMPTSVSFAAMFFNSVPQ